MPVHVHFAWVWPCSPLRSQSLVRRRVPVAPQGSNTIHSGIQDEIGQYIDSLTAFFESQGQYIAMYERNIHFGGNASHMNLQVRHCTGPCRLHV